MRVLLCHNRFRVEGGAEVFYREVGRVLEQNGHAVGYFSASDPEIEGTEWGQHAPMAPDYSVGSLLRRVARFPSMVYSQEAKRQFAALIDSFKPDVIHAFAVHVRLSPSILDAAREAGIPVVMSCNDYKHICPNYKLYHHGHLCEACKGGRFYQAILNRCCHDSLAFSVASSIEAYVHATMDIYRKNVHTFLFASEFMARKTEEFWGGDAFRWKLLRNPFQVPPEKPREGTGTHVLYFGRMIEEKGVDVLLHAMDRCRDVKLILVGDGPDREKLERQAEESALRNVEFVGPRWGRELDEYLATCRFVVVPSTWHENFPYVILQAFAAGKPVIGSNRGGIPELLGDDQRGLGYDAMDSEDLSRCIKQLWASPDAVSHMGSAARHFVEANFSDSVFYEQLINVYGEVSA